MRMLMNYEAWLADEMPSEAAPSYRDLPPLYTAALERWPEAFEFMRHHMFTYVASSLGFAPWGEILVSLWRRALASSKANTDDISGELKGAHDRFLRQYREAINRVREVPDTLESTRRLRAALQSYVAIYETDLPLWFLGVLGKALRTRRLELKFLGGPATTTSQGSLIESVRTALAGTPLAPALDAAYSPALRNAIQHNDFELKRVDGEVVFVAGDGSGTWSESQLWDLIEASQVLLQSVLLAAQVIQTTTPASVAGFTDCGISSMTYHLQPGGLPICTITQLWCFRDLDPAGAWLDRSKFLLRPVGADAEEVSLGGRARVVGTPISRSAFGDAVSSSKWVWIERLPVAPAIDLGLPVVNSVEGDRLEVVGPADRHLVPALDA